MGGTAGRKRLGGAGATKVFSGGRFVMHQTGQGKSQDTHGHTDALNALLRGEIAATETYNQALEKLGERDPAAGDLRRIRDDHRTAANTLRQHVHQHGGKPEHGSGVWGMWAKAVEGTAKMFGHAAALKALKEGEEHGAKSYEDALHNQHLPADCQSLIRGTLLPQCKSHISQLHRLMSTDKA
jgi:uncharacterized protein (TIGR02284 family)